MVRDPHEARFVGVPLAVPIFPLCAVPGSPLHTRAPSVAGSSLSPHEAFSPTAGELSTPRSPQGPRTFTRFLAARTRRPRWHSTTPSARDSSAFTARQAEQRFELAEHWSATISRLPRQTVWYRSCLAPSGQSRPGFGPTVRSIAARNPPRDTSRLAMGPPSPPADRPHHSQAGPDLRRRRAGGHWATSCAPCSSRATCARPSRAT
jgi:hypothetical protein